MSVISGLATGVLVEVIEKVLRRDNVPVTNSQAPRVAIEVARELEPVIANANNKEPWYQSRIFWVQIIAILSSVVGLVWGFEVSPKDQETVLLIILGINGLITPAGTLYARFKAGLKPLPVGEVK